MKYLKEGKWDDFQPNVEKIFKKIADMRTVIADMNKEIISEIKDIMVDLEDYQVSYEVYDDPSRSYLLCEYVFTIPSDKIQLASDLRDKLNDHIGQEGEECWTINWVNSPGANYKFRENTIEDVWNYLDKQRAPEPKSYNVEYTFFKIESQWEE